MTALLDPRDPEYRAIGDRWSIVMHIILNYFLFIDRLMLSGFDYTCTVAAERQTVGSTLQIKKQLLA